MSATEGVRGRLAAAADNLPATTSDAEKAPTIYGLIDQMKSEIARALPKHMNADRLSRVTLTVLKQTPRLLECTPASLLGALMLSAQLGLEPGPLGHCYFVPFKNSKTGRYEVQWIIGYKGIVDLAYRSGRLLSIEARDVRERDEFDFEYGLDPKLVHRPRMDGPRGDLTAVYCVAHFKDGGRYYLVMSRAEVEEHRARSKSKDAGPWVTDYEAMARKTVVRAAAPYLPLSAENADMLAGALANDERTRTDVTVDMYATAPPVIDHEPALEQDAGPANPGGDLESGEGVAGSTPEGTPGPASAPPQPMATRAQLTKLHAQLTELGITDRDKGLEYLSAFVERQLASSKELTREEASRIIEDHENPPPVNEPDAQWPPVAEPAGGES